MIIKNDSKDSLFDPPKLILGTKATTSKQGSQTARVTLNLLKDISRKRIIKVTLLLFQMFFHPFPFSEEDSYLG